jgi:N-acetylmuramate 1-kinase
MNQANTTAPEWAAGALARRWHATVGDVAALAGDASRRRFWRLSLAGRPPGAPASAILIDLGPDDLPAYAKALNLYPARLDEPPWINVHRFIESLGAPVPELYDWSAAARMLLVEDVGARTLFDALRENGAEALDLYRKAVRELTLLHVEGTRRRDPRCIAFQVAYDERLFRWELDEFLEYGLAVVAPGADGRGLSPELDELASRLGRIPRVLSHRDYHGGNLFVQEGGRLRMVDFQDALMAPAAQDLAVLLTTRDTGELITEPAEQHLVNFYLAGVAERGASVPARDDFIQSYRLCVLQHALKCIGRFVSLERDGKPGYKAYLPCALAQARRMLAELGGDFPRLRRALG